MKQREVTVIFQPSGRRGQVPAGITIVEASRLLGVDIEAPCGEYQVCGKCRVKIESGEFEKFGIRSGLDHISPATESEHKLLGDEQLREGYRLGCAATIDNDLLVYVPEEARAGKQVVSKAARQIDFELNPGVKRYVVRVEQPSLEDSLADFERVCAALEDQHGLKDLSIDVRALRTLSGSLRKEEWEVTVFVWMDSEVIRIEPGNRAAGLGLAIDIGTTTIAGYLCDLETGRVVDTLSAMNPQVKYGEDVVSRISYHMGNPDGLSRMSGDLITTLNTMISQAGTNTSEDTAEAEAADIPISPQDIVDVAICSNTAMHHILLQFDPEPLGSIPFTPSVHHSLNLKCRDLGINVHPGANLFVLPTIAGYVGGDTVGVMLAETPQDSAQTQLIIDIGTNGELVLGNRDKLICSSCATGPALEGAQIEFGMRAAPGAIERVKIDPQSRDVDYKVIGRKAWRKYSAPEEMNARGICGSGILDAVGELLLAGIVSKSGAFSKDAETSDRFRVNSDTGIKEFVLARENETCIGRDIVITQKDIRQIQMAKASIYTGCKLMMRRMDIDRVDTIKIAGAFGTHIDTRLAREIGMIPDCTQDSVSSVGNAAGDGCRIALLNREKREEADQLCRAVEYIELTLEDNFQGELVGATQLPHMTDPFTQLKGQH